MASVGVLAAERGQAMVRRDTAIADICERATAGRDAEIEGLRQRGNYDAL